jgi:hypothetical protein
MTQGTDEQDARVDALVGYGVRRTAEALRELNMLSGYYAGSRGVGHTEALITGAQQSRALVLAADQAHRNYLRQQGLNVETRSYLTHLRGMEVRMPLLVDHWALQRMVGDASHRLQIATAGLVKDIIEGRIQ